MSLSAATTVPRESLPLNSSTVVPGAVVPVIVGVLSLVNAIVVVISGAAGAVVSIVIGSPTDGEEVFPAFVLFFLFVFAYYLVRTETGVEGDEAVAGRAHLLLVRRSAA